jgi:nitrite reductase/ring-hydroxylating ferredoxin subunit
MRVLARDWRPQRCQRSRVRDIARHRARAHVSGRTADAVMSSTAMRRNDKLVEISRRDFCALAGCVGLIATGCTEGHTPPVSTGALGETPDAPPDAPQGDPDAPLEQADASVDDASVADASTSHTDAATGHIDASSGHADAASPPDASPPDAGATCASSFTDVGAASSFTTGSPTLFSSARYFVVRDSGGLYALSSICTHQGAALTNDGSEFYCPRHGATFDYDGNILGGPVSVPLVHYAMCLMSNGHVGVDSSQQVSKTVRLNA